MENPNERYSGYLPWTLQDIVRDLVRYKTEFVTWMHYMHPQQYLLAIDPKGEKLVDLGINQYFVWGQLVEFPSDELYDLQLKLHEQYKIYLAENREALWHLTDNNEIHFFFKRSEYLDLCDKLNIKSRLRY